MQPHILAQKLILNFSLHHDLVLWIVDFLTDRCQQVVVTCSRSPQDCVISPLLYILYTDDRRSNHENTYLVQFADDSALLSLLQGTQNGHGAALDDFIDWCDDSYLDLNVGKTKELIVEFRRLGYAHVAIQIHGLVSWCFEPSQPQRITSGLTRFTVKSLK